VKTAALIVGAGLLSAGAGVGIFGIAGTAQPVAHQEKKTKERENPPSGEPLVPESPIKIATGREPMPDISDSRVARLVAELKATAKMKSLLQEQLDAARREARARWEWFMQGRGTLEFYLNSSERLLEAERSLSSKEADRIAALENHWKRMRNVETVNRERFELQRIPVQDFMESRFYRVQAEIRLENAKSQSK
jgi:hypothetical protein